MTISEPSTDETVRISVNNENETSAAEEKKEEKPKTPQVTTVLEKDDLDEVRLFFVLYCSVVLYIPSLLYCILYSPSKNLHIHYCFSCHSVFVCIFFCLLGTQSIYATI